MMIKGRKGREISASHRGRRAGPAPPGAACLPQCRDRRRGAADRSIAVKAGPRDRRIRQGRGRGLRAHGRGRGVSIFLGKNRRHLGKSQSKWPPKRMQGPPHKRADGVGEADAARPNLPHRAEDVPHAPHRDRLGHLGVHRRLHRLRITAPHQLALSKRVSVRVRVEILGLIMIRTD
jgi:hypothetical protein